jgi:glycosyltransferase involved in cell wall biosynthesis
VVVGWIAAGEHTVDIRALKPAESLSHLLEAHANLRVLTVGVRLALSSDRYEHIPEVAYPDMLKVVSRLDVGIAPLVDSEFNRARSNVKLKEYASGGAAWAASPVGPYRELGRKQGGVLVPDDHWFDALDRLLRSRTLRLRLARRALRWAKTQTVDRHAVDWEKRFLLAMQSADTRKSA